MKKNNKKFVFLLILFLGVCGCGKFKNYELIVEKSSDDCTSKIISEFEINDQQYYYSCIQEITVKTNKQSLSLEEALRNKKIEMDSIYSKASNKMSYYDGGSTIYEYEYFNIINCNTLDGNKNIIFVPPEVNFTSEYCQN